MASKREIDALKSDLKDTSSKTPKRSPKKTKLLDQSTEKSGSRGRSRSRSRSRTPTRKATSSKTVTPRVKSSAKKSEKTPKSAKKTPKKTPKCSPSRPSKRKSDVNERGSAHKKTKSALTASSSSRTPATRRSTRLSVQSPRSELSKARVAKTVNFDERSGRQSSSADNQQKGWLSYCSLM